MNKQLMTFAEVSQDIKDAGHKRVAMFDMNGNTIVPFNNSKTPMPQRFEEIQKRFNSKITDEGVYQIHAKHFGSKATPAVYYVSKGNPDKNLADIKVDEVETVEIIQESKGHQIGQPFTVEEYKNLMRKNAELEIENERLQMKVERLEEDLAVIEEEEPKSQGFLSDSTKSFLQDSLETVIPIIDKVMDQRDKKIQLEALRIAQGNPQPLQQDAPVQHQAHGQHMAEQSDDGELTDIEEAELDGMAILHETNPGLYNEILKAAQEARNQEGGPQE